MYPVRVSDFEIWHFQVHNRSDVEVRIWYRSTSSGPQRRLQKKQRESGHEPGIAKKQSLVSVTGHGNVLEKNEDSESGGVPNLQITPNLVRNRSGRRLSRINRPDHDPRISGGYIEEKSQKSRKSLLNPANFPLWIL